MRITLTAIALLTGTFLGTASAAHAQSPDPSFCAQAPSEMLAALDGKWTLRQGPGFAIAGGATGNPNIPVATIPIPLPPHKGKALTLEFDSEKGLSVLKSQGQSLDMIPGGVKELSKVSKYLEAQDLKGLVDKKKGCNWYSLPIMIGTKFYPLKEWDPGTQQKVEPGDFKAPKGAWWSMIEIPGTRLPPMLVCVRKDGKFRSSYTGASIRDCEVPPNMRDAKGDMKMTLIVKFQSPTSGGGILLFEGKSQGYPFAAQAPVSLSR